MNNFRYFTLTAIIVFLFSSLNSQNNAIDSLKNKLNQSLEDTVRAKLYLHLAEKYEDVNRDSLFYFADKAVMLCDKNLPADIEKPVTDSVLYEFIKRKGMAYYLIGDNLKSAGKCDEAADYLYESIFLNGLIDNHSGVARNYTPLGICRFFMGDYHGAIEYFREALNVYQKIDDQQQVAAAFVNIGIIFRHQGLYDQAIENYMESLRVFEKLDFKDGIGRAYLNIGIIQNYQGNSELAIDYYMNALEIFKELGNRREVLRLYNNIGLVYDKLANEEKDIEIKKEYYDKALEQLTSSLTLAREIDDKLAVSAALANIGSIYVTLGYYKKALGYFTDALRIDKEIGDMGGKASIYNNLSSLHKNLAVSYRDEHDAESVRIMQEHLDKAIYYGHLSFDIAKEIGSLPTQRSAANVLKDIYKDIGRSNEALKFAEIYIDVNEKLYNEERTRALTEMQSKYEAEKKELEIENLNQEKALRIAELDKSEEQRKKQLAVIYSFIVGFIIVVVFSLIIFRLFIQKKKANILLAQQKTQIEQKNALLEEANEEISSQKEELEIQHDLVVNQKDFIEKQKNRIDDSIRYAKRIQSAIMPTDDYIESLFDDYFILFEPKDVVSGDFYWAKLSGDWVIVIAADCTGHGVPGAFMSMLGISFLNQITSGKKVTNAAALLNELREAVINALKQTHSIDSQVDGMDVSLAVINRKTYKCHWAGAYNPLWIIRNNSNKNTVVDKFEIVEEIKGDRMPIALHYRMNKFANHEIQLHKGDKLYLYSDGFVDQFGGLKNKKFSRKEFKKLIAETSLLPMKEQKAELEKTIRNWINPSDNLSYEQIDDMVVLGLQI